MEVNIVCSCKKRFDNNLLLLVLLLPCNHFIHETCINKCLLNNIKNCPLCSTVIEEILTEDKIKEHKHKQYNIDLSAIKCESPSIINYSLLPNAILNMNILINKAMAIQTKEDIIDGIEFIFKICKIKINILDNTKKNPIMYKNKKVEWKKKRDIEKKVVIIANHSNYLDNLILYYLFQSGFVSSEWINASSLGKIIANKCNVLVFKRDNKPGGNVERIKEYLEEFKKIVIYPEGIITYSETLIKFRTGAFNSCDNVCPVVIKHTPCINDDDFNVLLLKLLSQDTITIDVIINDFETGPFDDVKIENIRKNMAKLGDLKLSNLSNRKLNE